MGDSAVILSTTKLEVKVKYLPLKWVLWQASIAMDLVALFGKNYGLAMLLKWQKP